MKEYNISEKYKRIYQGILKWKQAGYKGLFQYTERIDIPLVISEVIQHINLQQYESDVEAYAHIVVPNNTFKDVLRKQVTSHSIIIEDVASFIQRITTNYKGKDLLYCDTFIMLDCTNSIYHDKDTYFKKMKKVAADRFLFVTTKKIPENMLKAFTSLGIPVVDIITKGVALKEGWISPYVIYNVGIDFTNEEKELYKQLTEQISSMLSIFKGKAKMVNYEFKKFTHLRMDMVEDDMALIKACHQGVNYVNNLTDKVEHIHSETVRSMVAEIMGWKKDIDLSNDYNKQVEMYWNPDNILTRTKAFTDAIEKRLELYNNNLNKREAIAAIIKNIKGKGLVLSKTRSITNYVETLDHCMCWYKGISSRICYDFQGNPYLYASGAKKGEPKVFGETGIRKECLKHLEHGDVSIIATDEIANSVFDVDELTTIICTSPYCKPFKTISDDKIERPYINKPILIIWLYMRDFTLNSDDYKTSKEKEKLVDAQRSFTTDIVWANSIKDVKF